MSKLTGRHSWIFIAIATIIPPIIAGLIEYFLTQGVSGWIPLVAGLGGGVFALLLLSFIGRHSTEMIAIPTEEQARIPVEQPELVRPSHPNVPPYKDKVFSPRTPSELIALAKGQTEIGAAHATKPHIGYWLSVGGSVLNVYESGIKKTLTVHIRDDASQESVFLHFAPNVWDTHLRPLTKEDRIAAIGKIISVNPSEFITLEECELVS